MGWPPEGSKALEALRCEAREPGSWMDLYRKARHELPRTAHGTKQGGGTRVRVHPGVSPSQSQ